MKFCTAVNCMDGRIQVPVITYLQKRFGVDYVDVVSEAGPNRILAEGIDTTVVDSIEKRVTISVVNHRSVGIAIVGHYDCAGNPTPENRQRQHTEAAVCHIQKTFVNIPVIGLWVDANMTVSELDNDSKNTAI